MPTLVLLIAPFMSNLLFALIFKNKDIKSFELVSLLLSIIPAIGLFSSLVHLIIISESDLEFRWKKEDIKYLAYLPFILLLTIFFL